MNRHLISAAVIAVAALGAGQAFADDITIDTTPFTSTKSRAEVQAELSQFKQAGVNPWSTSYNPLKSFQSAKSVAQVRGEFLAARNEVAAMNAEDSGSAYLNQTARVNTPTSTTLAGSPVNAQ